MQKKGDGRGGRGKPTSTSAPTHHKAQKSTVGTSPQNATSLTVHTFTVHSLRVVHLSILPHCPLLPWYFFSFFVLFPLTVSPLYRFMGPPSRSWDHPLVHGTILSLANARGPFFFFMTQCPSAHKRVAQCCSLGASFPFPFFLFFHLLTVPFSLMYMTSSCSPFCHASPLPRVAFATRRLCHVSSLSRRPFTTPRPLCHVPCHPLFTCQPLFTRRPSSWAALVVLCLISSCVAPHHMSRRNCAAMCPVVSCSPLSRLPVASPQAAHVVELPQICSGNGGVSVSGWSASAGSRVH
jgi:hypothetical protein